MKHADFRTVDKLDPSSVVCAGRTPRMGFMNNTWGPSLCVNEPPAQDVNISLFDSNVFSNGNFIMIPVEASAI